MPEIIEPTDGGIVENAVTMRLVILGYYETLDELKAAHPTGASEDCYRAGDNLYIWGENAGDWIYIGRIKGETGDAATISIGSVSTSAAGSQAIVTNTGTKQAAVFSFTIPQGAKGDTGEGFSIYKTYPSIAAMNADAANVAGGKFVLIASNVEDEDNAKLYVKSSDSGFIYLADLSGAQGIKGEQGPPGQDGANATVQVGTVTTGAEGTSAEVTNVGTVNGAILNFSIPRGKTGAAGPKGDDGLAALPGAVIPFYNVEFQGRHPIFWGKSTADTGWVICDGGSDLNGGTVPNLSDRFILGTTDAAKAKETGGSSTTGNATAGGTISNNATGGTTGYTTLALSQIPSHGHTYNQYAGGDGGPSSPGSWGSRQYTKWSTDAAGGSGSHAHGISGTEHSHTFTGSSHNHSATPPYYKLVYCVKLPE